MNTQMLGSLNGKVALVTGAAKGIGAAVARAFVAQGAQVLLTDLDETSAQPLLAELGPQAQFCLQDVSQEAAWERIATELQNRYGRLDILVNNAGILLSGTLEETSLQRWQQLMQVNAQSVFLGCRMAMPLMREGGGGSIINLSSLAALAAKHDYAAYCASKGAVAALTRAIAADARLSRSRIRCNSLHPDGVLTPMTRATLPAELDAEQLTINHDPMNRFCLPEDVAAAVLFLASDASRAINGMELRVDSGQFVMSI